jgi:hypothetical protein
MDKGELDMLKRLPNPPGAAMVVFDAVLLLLGYKKSDWKTAQSVLSDVGKFMDDLKNYPKESMSVDLRKKLKVKVIIFINQKHISISVFCLI